MSDHPGLGLVDAWPRRCGCGRSYTEHEWALLRFIGTMADDVESLELRDCACGSTIAQSIETQHNALRALATPRPSET